MAQHDHTLVLSFPSLSAFLSLPSSPDRSTCLETVYTAAKRARSSLLVVIRTAPDAQSPWGTGQGNDANSSISSSPASPPRPPPTSLFVPLERALSLVYSAATRAYLEEDRLLAKVDVVVEEMRGTGICLPSGADERTVERWEWPSETAVGGDGASGTAKGKGKAAADDSAPLPSAKIDDGAFISATGSPAPSIYHTLALGGTFDHLHMGHKLLLSMACSITSHKLIVGVSDDALLKNKKHRDLLDPLDVRIRNVESFVALIRPEVRCECVALQDVYGPTAHDPSIQALIVSKETKAGGDTINKLRTSRSLPPLDVWCISLVAHDAQGGSATSQEEKVAVEVSSKMGSTGIRKWLAKKREAEGAEKGT
ncbi:phosphopantetheine adenylyltransferase / dephospho-CoA kinase [Rhodotorula toruloides]|uniref:Phosphopantetheine adenylyltransferase / dephospho-CoA kinase n=1 Tax=Rhodotorula toruloides TaxID=5286 RepID=A0A511KJ57_RHOTO|nr:phosphopantetheine adenylyltransferase / dephospho-CoA kinase [Rhodotorula toruloides]